MRDLKTLVAVIHRNADSKYVLEKAAVVAANTNAEVHVVRVVYDDLVDFKHTDPDDAQRLKLFLMEAEEEFLVEIVDDFRSRFSNLETCTIWDKRTSSGVLEVAREAGADLIIKASGTEPAAFPRHPDDWNLLRQAECPVMLVKSQPWIENPVILAAADLYDDSHKAMNERVLDAGATLAGMLKGRLHVVTAYPRLGGWANDPNPGLEIEAQKIEQEIEAHAKTALADMGSEAETLHVKEGKAANVIAEVAEETAAELIVIGTAGREGVPGFVIGNTSETLLHLVPDDILVLRV